MRAHAPKTKGLVKLADSATSSLSAHLETLPAQARKARRLLAGFGDQALRLARKHPVRTAAGALLVGAALTKIASRA